MLLSAIAVLLSVIPSPAADSRWSTLVVDLSDQHVYVYDPAGLEIRRFPASTGSASTPSPTGSFKVTSKSVSTFVRDNPSVTMRHMVRFRGGIGFHGIPRKNGIPLATPLGKRPVSHGCIRLADANARELFENVAIGTLVVVRR